ncbi:MAG: sulfatase-like hydrolase/transferase [Cetobacterium sp.]
MFYIKLLSYFTVIYLMSILLFTVERKSVVYLKKLFIFILGFYGLLNILSYFTKKTLVNVEIITNILDITTIKEGFKNFLFQSLLSCFVIIAFIVFVIFYEDKLSRKIKRYFENFKNKQIVIIYGFIAIILSKDIFLSLNQNISLIKLRDKTLQESLYNLGINPKDYVSIENIKADAGKNVVIIYLESFEKNWMDKDLFEGKELTPNLNRISKDEEWKFFSNYRSLPGSTWTFGAQYATATGIPTYFGFEANTIFQTIQNYRGVSIGNILKKAGYSQTYMRGADLNFAGSGNMYKYFGYEVFGKNELPQKYIQHDWGVRDKDLFEEAKKKYTELSKNNKPFNLTLLTVDTHFPKGYPDARMVDKITRENLTDLEYAVKSVDYLVNDFIEFLKKQENYKDTVIYILPDHVLMGSEILVPEVSKLSKKERKLFFMTNSKDFSNLNSDDEITLYDIPQMILKGIRVKTNFKFIGELNKNLKLESKNIETKISDLNLNFIEDNKNMRILNSLYETKYLKLKFWARDLILGSNILSLKRNYEFRKDFEKKSMEKLPQYKFTDEIISKLAFSKEEILKEILNGRNYIELELKESILDSKTRVFITELVTILEQYQDVFIVLKLQDDFGAFGYIKSTYPNYVDRFIPEVNAKYKYHIAYKLGFKKIIYTLYEDENKTQVAEIVDFAEVTNITAVRFSKEKSEYKGLGEKLEKKGINYFAY